MFNREFSVRIGDLTRTVLTGRFEPSPTLENDLRLKSFDLAVGGESATDLIAKLSKDDHGIWLVGPGLWLGKGARRLIESEKFGNPELSASHRIKVVKVRPTDLGLVNPTREDFFAAAVKTGLLKLLPPEVGPQARLQDMPQSVSRHDVYFIGMHPVDISHEKTRPDPVVFRVQKASEEYHLTVSPAYNNRCWYDRSTLFGIT